MKQIQSVALEEGFNEKEIRDMIQARLKDVPYRTFIRYLPQELKQHHRPSPTRLESRRESNIAKLAVVTSDIKPEPQRNSLPRYPLPKEIGPDYEPEVIKISTPPADEYKQLWQHESRLLLTPAAVEKIEEQTATKKQPTSEPEPNNKRIQELLKQLDEKDDKIQELTEKVAKLESALAASSFQTATQLQGQIREHYLDYARIPRLYTEGRKVNANGRLKFTIDPGSEWIVDVVAFSMDKK